jgi:uncharacterized protein (TIGR02145 family)
VSLLIGGGTNVSGKIADIQWGAGNYFLKTETDPSGGTNYSITGTTQLVSVPYAMYAGVAGNLKTSNVGLPGQVLMIDKDNKLIWTGTSVPTVITNPVFAITQTGASAGGVVSSDGGAMLTARGIIWSTSPNPSISLATKTNDGTGIGSFNSLMTALTPNTKYFVRAYATNSAGTSYGADIEFLSTAPEIPLGSPCPGTPTIKDIDGNIYNTVQIGTQCWMKENLRVTRFRSGAPIPLDTSGGPNGDAPGETWTSKTTGARTIYGNDIKNLETYGYLYNWYVNLFDVCPEGWRVTQGGDFVKLWNYLGGYSVAGGKIKATGTTYWMSPNYQASNLSGFSALPNGVRLQNGKFQDIGRSFHMWFNYEYDYWFAETIRVFNDSGTAGTTAYHQKYFGASIRCIRD